MLQCAVNHCRENMILHQHQAVHLRYRHCRCYLVLRVKWVAEEDFDGVLVEVHDPANALGEGLDQYDIQGVEGVVIEEEVVDVVVEGEEAGVMMMKDQDH